MTEMKYLNWLAIFVLLIVMILMLLLGYQGFSFLLFIPIIFNLILIAWAKALDKKYGANPRAQMF